MQIFLEVLVVAVFLFKPTLSFTLNTFVLETFESASLTLKLRTVTLTVFVVYRPPRPNQAEFLAEFEKFLDELLWRKCFIIVGDFNIHVNDSTSKFASNFLNLLTSYSLSQFVHATTHCAGNTLDLIIAPDYMTIHNVLILPECDFVVDHFPITFTTPLLVDKSPKYFLKCIRSTRSFNFKNWCSFISNYVPASDDVSSLYRDSAATYLDLHCPRRVAKSRTLSDPWFDAELESLRTSRRKAEHAFLKNRTDVSLFAYRSARTLYRSALQRKHHLYYTDLLSSCSKTLRRLEYAFTSLPGKLQASIFLMC